MGPLPLFGDSLKGYSPLKGKPLDNYKGVSLPVSRREEAVSAFALLPTSGRGLRASPGEPDGELISHPSSTVELPQEESSCRRR